MSSETVLVESIASSAKNSVVGGPFGSNLVSKDYVSDGVPVIRGQNMGDKWVGGEFVFVSNDKARALEPNKARPGDLVFTQRGTLGQVAIVPLAPYSEYIVSQSQMKLTPDPDKADVNYLYYAFLSPEQQDYIRNTAIQTGVPHTNLGILKKTPIALPAISVQREIGRVLGALDDRITLLRETNATLEAIAQALFKSWFVDFDPVRAKQEGRAPDGMDEATAALFPDSFEESELGLVPRGWPVSKLDSVSDVGIGKTPPRKEPHWFSESSDDIRWVSIRDMGSAGVFLSETSEYLTQEAIDRFYVRRVPDRTVLLSFKLTIGRVVITDGEMTTNEAIAHCKLTDQSPLSSEYIYLHLRQFDYATLSSTSSIADAVNSKTVKAIPILVPSTDVVAAFQSMVGLIFERIKTVQQQAQTLATLRDTLLPRLISGQLRPPEAEAMLAEV